MKELEAALGLRLFERKTRSLELTTAVIACWKKWSRCSRRSTVPWRSSREATAGRCCACGCRRCLPVSVHPAPGEFL